MRTDLFLPVIAYFFGNMYGLAVVKVSEKVWQTKKSTNKNSKINQQKGNQQNAQEEEDEKERIMVFSHLIKISKPAWDKLHAQQLIISASILYYFLYLKMLPNWAEVERQDSPLTPHLPHHSHFSS